MFLTKKIKSLEWVLSSSGNQLLFFVLAVISVIAMLTSLRVALLLFNLELAVQVAPFDLLQSLGIGIRFDLIMTAYACLPLTLLPLFGTRPGYRKICTWWLTMFSGAYCFLAIIEFSFYAEFQQRLNSLVFMYLREDPRTLLSMIWSGFPVVTHLMACLLVCTGMYLMFNRIERGTRYPRQRSRYEFVTATAMILGLLTVEVAFARGTTRSGPPLRWGDAYQSDHLFANQLALNGSYTLGKAWLRFSDRNSNNYWHTVTDPARSRALVREMILTERDKLVDPDAAVIRRMHDPGQEATDTNIKNIVIILMESFSGQHTGALGNSPGVTPHFDRLAAEGLLFTRFFSNGTHTHQGMFATVGCFPNLPGYEYLMQQPEGRNQFSGISRLLDQGHYQNLYLYNGDFAWDNQAGFFSNQGIDTFIGRDDIRSPRFVDTTWGVSDEDMFNQALSSLAELSSDRPFFAILQTLSNHTPYSLPDPLQFDAVLDENGEVSDRLTAMKYSDWALGQFFEGVRGTDYYDSTLFIILGDHGFKVDTLISDVNLLRFHVPMLMIGPGIVEDYGHRMDRVATQVDVVPTVMGLLGKPFQHQCWGRNLLALPREDQGVGVIKSSGGDNTVAIIQGDYLLTDNPDKGTSLLKYELIPQARSMPIDNPELKSALKAKLRAYVNSAINSLETNTASDR
jgi:phosphoglycerol transferase MdoB-like AlkP superfamily enzyme